MHIISPTNPPPLLCQSRSLVIGAPSLVSSFIITGTFGVRYNIVCLDFSILSIILLPYSGPYQSLRQDLTTHSNPKRKEGPLLASSYTSGTSADPSESAGQDKRIISDTPPNESPSFLPTSPNFQHRLLPLPLSPHTSSPLPLPRCPPLTQGQRRHTATQYIAVAYRRQTLFDHLPLTQSQFVQLTPTRYLAGPVHQPSLLTCLPTSSCVPQSCIIAVAFLSLLGYCRSPIEPPTKVRKNHFTGYVTTPCVD